MKHTKEYAEMLAVKECQANEFISEKSFTIGYMKAIKETNVAELLEALKLIAQMADGGKHENAILEMKNIAINAIKKAE